MEIGEDYSGLLERAGRARFALVGEASHGTHEFYRERAEITKQLIAEHGFAVVAAEADWPDAYRVNLFVRGESDDDDSEEALGDFRRFPAWMWRNTEVADFVGWLQLVQRSPTRHQTETFHAGVGAVGALVSSRERGAPRSRRAPRKAA